MRGCGQDWPCDEGVGRAGYASGEPVTHVRAAHWACCTQPDLAPRVDVILLSEPLPRPGLWQCWNPSVRRRRFLLRILACAIACFCSAQGAWLLQVAVVSNKTAEVMICPTLVVQVHILGPAVLADDVTQIHATLSLDSPALSPMTLRQTLIRSCTAAAKPCMYP